VDAGLSWATRRVNMKRRIIPIVVLRSFVFPLLLAWAQTPGKDTAKRQQRDKYIWRSRLTSTILDSLKSMGDRLEVPGKERLILLGSLSLPTENRELPLLLVRGYPKFVNLVLGQGQDVSIIKFDGIKVGVTGRLVSGRESEIVQFLAQDTVEQFFFAQMRGYGTRFLGDHFQLKS